MRIIFFGTPDYTLPILKALAKKYEIAAVVTQNPKPTGRKQQLAYSPIDTWAHKRKVPVVYLPAQAGGLDKVPKADLGILAAYGKIIPESLIKNFKFGILNIHPSLLPKYRGASPVQAAIADGEKVTGVTIIKLDSEMDHGPILSKFRDQIQQTDTTETLRQRLFARSAEFLLDLLPNYLSGKIKPREQDHDKATYTKIITKQDGFINPDELTKALEGANSKKLYNNIRALQPWPTTWTYINLERDRNAKRLRILKYHLEGEKLVLDEIQLEGKNPVTWEQFKQGYPDSKLIHS